MRPDTILKFLRRTGMEDAQAEALSQIFSEMATSSDLRMLDGRFQSFEEKMDARFRAFEEKMDARFRAFEEKMDAKFAAFEEKMDAKFAAFEEKMDARFVAFEEKFEEKLTGRLNDLKADLTWKMIAIVTLFGTIITVVNAFL